MWLLPEPGGPNSSRLAPFASQASPEASAMTRALLSIGTWAKSKLSSVLSGGRRASARLSPRSAKLACSSRSMQVSSVSVITPARNSATSFTRHISFATPPSSVSQNLTRPRQPPTILHALLGRKLLTSPEHSLPTAILGRCWVRTPARRGAGRRLRIVAIRHRCPWSVQVRCRPAQIVQLPRL